MNSRWIYAFIHWIKAPSAFSLPRRNAQLCVCPDSPLLWFIDILWKFFEIWTCKSCWKENSLNSSSPRCCKEFLFFLFSFFYTFSYRWTIVRLSIKVKKDRRKGLARNIYCNKFVKFLLYYRCTIFDIFKVLSVSSYPPSSKTNKLN